MSDHIVSYWTQFRRDKKEKFGEVEFFALFGMELKNQQKFAKMRKYNI